MTPNQTDSDDSIDDADRIRPGDVVIDRATNSPLYVVAESLTTAADHEAVRQDDTSQLFGATGDDRVYECVYLPNDGEVRPPRKTYEYAESRLFKYPVARPATGIIVDPPTWRILDDLAETVARDLDDEHRRLLRELVELTYGETPARSVVKHVEALAADNGDEE